MKRVGPYLIILMLSCYALTCSAPKNIESPPENTEQAKPFPAGDYQYVSYDQKGDKVVEGRLSITSVQTKRIQSEEQIQLKGNWQLNKAGNQERIGDQTGSGLLVGSIIQGKVYINLNPNIADANVFLEGTIEGKRFHGMWSFKGLAGTISQGTFEANRK
ncbi:MAG: hypothetical protein M3362_08200 [Acidobacteriota bacterium]|nr:hypothetical protein [Acidobacteriota bacterium]